MVGRLAGSVVALAALAVLAASAPAPDAAAGPSSSAPVHLIGAAGDRAGTSVAAAGDVNGDGAKDVIVGAPGALLTPSEEGSGGIAYVVYGPFTAGETIDLGALGARGFTISGSQTTGNQQAGRSVAAAGDVNGDGIGDVLVGAPGGNGPGAGYGAVSTGKAYVVFGSRTPVNVRLSALGTRGIEMTGRSGRFPDFFGWQVAPAGDVNHDRRPDIVIAAPGNPGFEDASTHGSAYVVFGRSRPGRISMAHLGSSGFRIGPASAGGAGSVSGAGDWNRDGRADVALVDSNALHGEGAAWVVYGKASGATVDLGRLGSRGVLIRAGRTAVHYGLEDAALAGGADATGDRRPDLVIGAPRSNGAWIVRGSVSPATVSLKPPSTRAWKRARGAARWAAGSAVGLGRVNGDARADIAMIAHGSVAVVYGSASRTTLRLDALTSTTGFLIDGSVAPIPSPPATSPQPGFGHVAVGDIGGSSRADLLVGALCSGPDRCSEQTEPAGGAYLYLTP